MLLPDHGAGHYLPDEHYHWFSNLLQYYPIKKAGIADLLMIYNLTSGRTPEACFNT